MSAICGEHDFHQDGTQVVDQPDGSQQFILTAAQVKKYKAFLSDCMDTAFTDAVVQEHDLDPDDIANAVSGKFSVTFSFEWMGIWVATFPTARFGEKHLCLLDDE